MLVTHYQDEITVGSMCKLFICPENVMLLFALLGARNVYDNIFNEGVSVFTSHQLGTNLAVLNLLLI